MKRLRVLASWISAHITLLVVTVTALALFIPASFCWIQTSVVTPLLGLVMFGMGMTLKPADFLPVLTNPRDIILGELSQFVIMPVVAWLLCRLLSLPQDLALGVILVGCCPGGTASNVMCYLGKGDVALSVGMTAISTMLAPLVTPLLVLLLAGQDIEVDALAMFVSILQVVILPTAAGFAVSHWFRAQALAVTPLLPMLSTLAVAAIIGIVVSHNAASILGSSLLVAAAVILHNLSGLGLGYTLARLTGMSKAKSTAISIEVGMQNSGLATSLAATHFAMFPMVAVPGAIFSAWHNFSGSIAAGLFAKNNP